MGLFDSSFWNMGGGNAGGGSPWGNASFFEVLGPALQDLGQNWQGGQGNQLQKLQKKQQYQQMLQQMIGSEQLNPVTVTPSMLASGAGTSAADREAAYSAPAMSYQGGMIGNNPMLQKMAPIIANADPEIGMPLLLNTMVSEGQYERERADKKQKPMEDAKKAALGFGPDDIVYEDTLGNPVVVQKGESLSPEALRQKLQIAAASRSNFGGGSSTPSNVQEWQYYSKLTPEQQQQYLNLRRGNATPEIAFNQSAARAGGKSAGELAEQWPSTAANFKLVNDTLQGFYDPKVRAQAGKAVGMGSYMPTIPGVNSDFRARQEQLQGQVFLTAYESLKGSGQITEVEGQKAERAKARLLAAQTEKEYYAALDDFKKALGDAHYAARVRAQRGMIAPQMGGAVNNGPMPGSSYQNFNGGGAGWSIRPAGQ